MKRYESYKPSGISWIGQIPSHWEVAQLRKFLSLVSIKGHGNKQLLSVTREQGVIVRDMESKDANHNYIPDDLSNYKLVKKGQFAINKMKSWQGSYAVSNYEGIVSPAYYVCDLNFDNKDFFSWAIRSKAYIPFFTQMSKGIRVDQWDLSTNALKDIPFFVPTPEEQKKIVEFLSTKTSLIDAQQRERERELRLLDELKQAEIANVVTRGLNPDVPMKDSGIPWIGQIPAHWEVKPLSGLIARKQTQANPADKKIGLENIESWSGNYVETNTVFDGTGPHFDIGDILYGKLRPYLAKTWVATFSGQAVGDFYVFRNKNISDSHYITYLLLNPKYVFLLDSFTYGAKMPRVSWDDMGKVYVTVPPIEEQKAIVAYIQQKTQSIDEMIASLRAEIDFLTEYKQRLIADVVTGQVNVQNL